MKLGQIVSLGDHITKHGVATSVIMRQCGGSAYLSRYCCHQSTSSCVIWSVKNIFELLANLIVFYSMKHRLVDYFFVGIDIIIYYSIKPALKATSI